VLANLNEQATELRESRERLEVTLRSIGDGVIVTDAAGRITFINAVAEDLTQSTNQNAQGRNLEEIFQAFYEESRARAESPARKVIRHASVVGLSHHKVLVRPDGSEIYIHDSGAPIRNDRGELLGIVVVFRDVTQQRLTMDALRSNEKLVVAGRLSAAIAHEIHNPLDVVMNLLYLIEQSASEEQTRLVKLAQQELSRVAQITKSMLGLYRESKEPVRVKLAEIVDSVAVLMEKRIREKSVHLVKPESHDGAVTGFPAEIRQIVSNLVSNAIDAVGTGGTVEISIADTWMKDGRPGARLCVRDNGNGISDQHMQQLFRPFFTTKGEHGTGLGLWISQGIIEKHGGYIEVESSTEDHSGTSFQIYLPNSGGEQAAASVTSSSFHV
jgi:PAS domain S-box-containing protein